MLIQNPQIKIYCENGCSTDIKMYLSLFSGWENYLMVTLSK